MELQFLKGVCQAKAAPAVLSFCPAQPLYQVWCVRYVCQAKAAAALNQQSDGCLLAAKQPSIHLAHPHTPFYPLTRF